MKKAFFVFLFLPLLVSCQASMEERLSVDEQKLVDASESEYLSTQDYFIGTMSVEKKEDYYHYTYQISSPKEDYTKVRVILTPDKKNFFFFGYNEDYTLVKDVSRQAPDKRIYSGIRINFMSDTTVSSYQLYFQSEQVTFYFQTSL